MPQTIGTAKALRMLLDAGILCKHYHHSTATRLSLL